VLHVPDDVAVVPLRHVARRRAAKVVARRQQPGRVNVLERVVVRTAVSVRPGLGLRDPFIVHDVKWITYVGVGAAWSCFVLE
jgi:hypothetical protein